MSGRESSHTYLQLAAECAHNGLREIIDGQGRRRWLATCGHCGKEDSVFRSDVRNAQQILSHFNRARWVLARKSSPYCSRECQKMSTQANNNKSASAPPPAIAAIGPNPIIMRRVITLLNDQFDMKTRLYRESYSDERVAKEAETSLEFVTTFRRGAYGELAEDPMISKLRDEVAALKALQNEELAKMRATFEAQNKELDYKLARLAGTHKAAG
jgi:hypothetical protein